MKQMKKEQDVVTDVIEVTCMNTIGWNITNQ